MKTSTMRWLAGLAVVAGLTMAAEDAKACGGCFAPPGPATQVSAHRMAFAVSAKRTVLWDQIQYVGAPSDFGWVLPIRGKVDIGVSSETFFERLEGASQPQVTPPPPPTCPEPTRVCRTTCYGGEDFGAADASSAGSAADTGSVDVWSTSVVGPYEAVQLSATDSNALLNWLKDHGYVVPPAVTPVIDKYVAEGFGFLAIKLVPKADTTKMVPIRIGFDGSSPTLPLRMVAAGTGDKVGIKLFVLGDGRWETKNFANEEIKTSDLVWDWATMASNFSALEVSLIAKHAGSVFLTEASESVAKTTLVSGLPPGTETTEAGTVFSTITDQSELDTAFPTRTSVTLTRLFAELPASSLATDLDLQASLGPAVPHVRQAPKSTNYYCPTTIEVDCPGITPTCDATSDGGVDDGGNTLDPLGVGKAGSDGGGAFGCSTTFGGTPFTTGLAVLAGVSLLSAVRRRRSQGKMGDR